MTEGRTVADMIEPQQPIAFIEIPKGSRNKYELDKETGRVMLDRCLFTSMAYPADYGFIDGTLGEDGDPLDALVIVTEPTFPGCGIRVRPIGVFHMEDEKGPDEKIICVPLKDPRWSHVQTIDELGDSFLAELAHFFEQYGQLEGKKVETSGFDGRKAAERFIAEARERLAQSPSS